MAETESLPVLVPKVRRLDAYEFSNYDDPKYSFGLSAQKAIETLREVANRIESGEYLVQSGGILTQADREDYVMTYLTIEFHAKKVSEP